MERELDEEFEHEGITLKCVQSHDCKGCFFDVRKNDYCNDRKCASEERTDKLNVKFIRIK